MSEEKKVEVAPAWFWNLETGEAELFEDHPVGGKPPKGYQDTPVEKSDGDSA